MNDAEGIMLCVLLVGGGVLLDSGFIVGGLVAVALGVLMFVTRSRRNHAG